MQWPWKFSKSNHKVSSNIKWTIKFSTIQANLSKDMSIDKLYEFNEKLKQIQTDIGILKSFETSVSVVQSTIVCLT